MDSCVGLVPEDLRKRLDHQHEQRVNYLLVRVPGWSEFDEFTIMKLLSRFNTVLSANLAGKKPRTRCFKSLHRLISSAIFCYQSLTQEYLQWVDRFAKQRFHSAETFDERCLFD